MSFPRELVDAIRDRTDLVALIGRSVTLTRRGNSFVGLCPFHQERTPSFHVVPTKGLYHCFGCQEGGDAFRFLMKTEGLSFAEAVRELAKAAGLEVPEREISQEDRERIRERATLYEVLEAAAAFYNTVLLARPEGQPGRDYLVQRAMATETVQRGRLGFAPAGWNRLSDVLHRRFPAELVLRAGLTREGRDGGRPYDLMRERLIFPIFDERARVIAFGGRILAGDGPKYLNTPESPLYEKTRTLYGLQVARNAIQRQDRVIVVEGYFDVLAMHQAGFEETVATCGTALTEGHLDRLLRLTRNVLLVLDSDEAGSKAAERALPLLAQRGVSAWRVELPGAKDPDELLRAEGPAPVRAALESKRDLVSWVIERKLRAYAEGGRTGPMARERALEELLPVLRYVRSDLEIAQIAATLGLDDRRLKRQIEESSQRAAPATGAIPAPAPPGFTPTRDQVHLLWLLVHRLDQVADLLARIDNPDHLELPAPLLEIVARLLTGEPVAALLEGSLDGDTRRVLLAIVARDRLYDPDQAANGMVQVLARLTSPRRTSLRQQLRSAYQAAAAEAQPTARRALEIYTGFISQESTFQRALDQHRYPEAAEALFLLLQAGKDAPPDLGES